jgi:transcriptional regulator with XRE-family HTH domain
VAQGIKNPLWTGLTRRLSLVRETAGLFRRDLSRAAYCGDAVVAAIERGTNVPKVDTVERLAAALGIPPGWLAYGDEGTEPFRQRRPRSPVPLDPPVPEPGKREPAGLYKAVGERCKHARDARGLSLRAVAKAAGISAQSLLLTEAGETVPLVSTCEALAVSLDVSPCWLAYGYGVGVESNGAE